MFEKRHGRKKTRGEGGLVLSRAAVDGVMVGDRQPTMEFGSRERQVVQAARFSVLSGRGTQ